jgi:polysaccharide export outer membrane protein
MSDGTCSPRTLFRNIGKLAVLVFWISAGCQEQATTTLPQQFAAKTPTHLAAGDVLRVTFPGAPELGQSQRIRPDGKIILPLIGEVSAAGKTLRDFQSELTQLYKPQLQDSEVVLALESISLPVTVGGAVEKPGRVIFERPATVLEAIMEAGGFNQYANTKKVTLVRTVNGQQYTQILDLSPVLRGTPTRAIYVNGGDVIYVPLKLF